MPRRIICRTLPTLLATIIGLTVSAAEEPPPWAYPFNPKDFKPVQDDGSIRRVPGSTAGYTLTQTRDRFAATDWHPEDYPPMPDLVANGRKPDVFACGWCHRADGSGGPENANIAGLPEAYFIQQMRDFRGGVRTTSVARRTPTTLMLALSKAISDDEISEAARHFARIRARNSIRVIETDEVPETFVAGWFLADAGNGRQESIGRRVIEVPENLDQFESRDPRVRFVAYVPRGSIARGARYVATGGGGKSPPCATCHGPDLQGAENVPPIVGRYASYLVRQLYDLKYGARNGPGAIQMKPVVESMSLDEMVDVVAYLTSRAP